MLHAPAGQGQDPIWSPRIAWGYYPDYIVAKKKKKETAQAKHVKKKMETKITHPKIANVREGVGVARVIYVNNDIREVCLLRIAKHFGLIL
jgi:hypothetical protein